VKFFFRGARALNHSFSGFFRSRGAFFRIPRSTPVFFSWIFRTERRLQKRTAEKDRRKGPQKTFATKFAGGGQTLFFSGIFRTAEKDRRKGPSGGRRKPFQQTQSKKIIQNNLNNLK
jgi:hypothetical protein